MITRWLCRSLLLLACSAPSFAQELSGTLRVDPLEVPLGDPVVIHQRIQNTGSITMSGILVTLTIVDTSLSRVVAEFSDLLPVLGPGDLFEAVRGFQPNAPAGTVFNVLLTALDIGSGELASAQFRIKAQPIRVELEQELPKYTRVLAYVDCGGHDGKSHRERRHEDDGGSGGRCAAADRLEAMLRELRLAHVVVRNEWRFLQELRGGRHNVYVLAGRICDEAGDVLGELRESVFRGDGLLADGSAGESELDRVAGLERGRRLRFRHASLRVDGPLFTPARLPLAGGAWRFQPTTGAPQASFFGRVFWPGHAEDNHASRDEDDDDDGGENSGDLAGADHQRKHHGYRWRWMRVPAIVSNDYGRGHALAFAFDLLESHRKAPASRGRWTQLLGESLQYLTPQPDVEVGALDYAVLETRVTNASSAAVDAELAFTLPAGMAAEDVSPPVPPGPDGVLRVRESLAPGETRELRLGLRMPGDAGRQLVDTVVSDCSGDPCGELSSLSFAFSVISPTEAADEVIAELQGLPLDGRADERARDQAIRRITHGIAEFDRGRYQRAIARFVEAADALARIRSVDIGLQRLAVARMLAEAERRWSTD